VYLIDMLASVPDTLLSSNIPISNLYTLRLSILERFKALESVQQLRLTDFTLLSV